MHLFILARRRDKKYLVLETTETVGFRTIKTAAKLQVYTPCKALYKAILLYSHLVPFKKRFSNEAKRRFSELV